MFKVCFLGSLLLLFFSRAQGHYLEIRKQYLTPNYLAASQVNTPDPRRNCFCGEDLILRWKAPSFHGKKLSLHLQLFFGNWTREEMWVDLPTCVGYTRYRLLNDSFYCKGGIVAYKAEFFVENLLLQTRCHPLWVEEVKPKDG